MKLPADRQQRIKVLIIIGLVAALVILGLVQGVAVPLRNNRKAKIDRLRQSQDGVEEARKEMRLAPLVLKRNREAVESVLQISDACILKPVLGNYLLSATEQVEAAARDLGLAEVSVREVGISEIPRMKEKKAGTNLKVYAARVTLLAGYDDLVRLMSLFESRNPYLCVSTISIQGQPQADPERHAIVFEIQWPIWADPETPATLAQDLDMGTVPDWMVGHAN